MNKMKLVLTKIGIAISALAMIVAFNGASSGFAAGGTQPEPNATTQAGDPDTSAEVAVPPWCGWNINPILADIELQPAGEYTGPLLALSGTTDVVRAYVGGTNTATEQLGEDNCSWFGMTPNSATFNVTTSTDGFTAESDACVPPEVGPCATPDEAMNWLLNETGASLRIVNVFDAECADQGFSANNETAEFTGAATASAWSIASGLVGTNDYCSYSVTYNAAIPANQIPTYGESTYTFTGPTLLHTLTTSTPE